MVVTTGIRTVLTRRENVEKEEAGSTVEEVVENLELFIERFDEVRQS
jgi:hypothetical protein